MYALRKFPSPLVDWSASLIWVAMLLLLAGNKFDFIFFILINNNKKIINSWKDLVPGDVEVWAWQPTAIHEWKELLDLLTNQVSFFEESNVVPVTLYGHSLGALIAFEVACKLQNEGK